METFYLLIFLQLNYLLRYFVPRLVRWTKSRRFPPLIMAALEQCRNKILICLLNNLQRVTRNLYKSILNAISFPTKNIQFVNRISFKIRCYYSRFFFFPAQCSSRILKIVISNANFFLSSSNRKIQNSLLHSVFF